MTMTENKENKAKEKQYIVEKLNSDNPLIIKEILIELRDKGNSEYIPLLFDLLLKHQDSKIADTIKSFISDIKDSSLKEILIASIRNEKFNRIKKDLLTICWESRFDFSSQLNIFVDCLINDDFISAFEALTVIENLNADISEEIKNEQIKRLKEAITDTDKNKRQLIHDAIHIISQIRYSEF